MGPLYETTMFYVNKVEFEDPLLKEKVEGYGVFNKHTSVREAECRRLGTAKRFCHQFEGEEQELTDDLIRDMEVQGSVN